MTQKPDKLREKLKRGKISSKDLKSLLEKSGAVSKSGKGSHVSWTKDGKVFVLSVHGNEDLKPYQIKQAKEFLDVK